MAKKKKLDQYADDRERFDRQPGEGIEAYQAFLEYARMPYGNRDDQGRPGPRSITLAADAVGKAVSLLKGWSSAWRWVERAEAYDRAQRLAEQKAIQAAESEANLRAARRRVALRDEAWTLFEQAKTRVSEALAFPLFHEEEEVLEDGDGGPTLIVHRHPLKDVTPSSVASLARAAMALGLVAVDDGSGALDRLLSEIDPEHLSTEQLEALAQNADPIRVLLSGGTAPASGEGGTGTEEAAGSGAG